MIGLTELREQGKMTWIERELGWVAAPREIVPALSKGERGALLTQVWMVPLAVIALTQTAVPMRRPGCR